MNSLPKDFIEYIKTSRKDDADDLLESLNNTSVTSIRIHPEKGIHDFKQTERVPWASNGFYINERPSFTLDPLFHAGSYYVQEASSMFLEQFFLQHVNVNQPLVVLDLCAAPGGKSTHILSLISGESLLIANDVVKTRAHILSENIQKWGSANAIVTNSPVEAFSKMRSMVDVVIIDAPCSGEGMFRKDINARNEWSIAHVKACSMRQKKIIQEVWPCLKEEGILIYSTCTLNEFENEQNIEWLKENFPVTPLTLSIPAQWNVEEVNHNDVYAYRLLPHKVRGEGFFIAAFKRCEANTLSKNFNRKNKIPSHQKSMTTDVSNLVNTEEHFLYFYQDSIFMLPETLRPEAMEVMSNAYVIHAGLHVCEVKKKNIIPSHSLALSPLYVLNSFPDLELDKESAIAYLSRKDFFLVDVPDGIYRATYKGVGLGWLKKIQNRYNNYYPSEWRIRIQTE
ncbi:MAG: RsmF rRNA methyltransferase first C-terminal domain-containing protein [Cytophagaceae bacterium]|nr:RsmF rRNA methyltransferase first C-terminal domain-containing protein [Cytophagaceae bacterium]MDW8456864.1 RsmF rRNA methyltransferase first C-terminal domain-containing protein [Cytophagaceae bacterium]